MVGEWLQRTSRLHPGKAAVICQGAHINYRALAERTARVANLWTAGLGLARGDRIALLASNGLEHAELLLGGALSGVVTVLLNFRLTARELAQILADSDARVLVSGERFRSVVEGIVACGFAGQVLWLGPEVTGEGGYEAALGQASPFAAQLPATTTADPILQIYTSGTTGTPKGAVISHRNIGAFAWTNEAEGTVRPDDVHLVATPLCFLAPAARLLMNVHIGATSVVLPDFDAGVVTNILRSGEVTTVMVVPAMLKMLNEHPSVGLAPGRLRLVLYGGAPMPRPVIEAALERFPVDFHQGYGLTETLTLTTLRPEDHRGAPALLGSVGRAAIGVDVRVIDDAGSEVVAGGVGEIVARGGGIMEGYFRNPAATAETLRGGWAYTGDLATVDDAGFIFMVDRRKEMLISGGINVYPREIELVLEGHPQVKEVAVVGRPDAKWGEVPVAFVVPRSSSDALAAALAEYLRERLAKFKLPREYFMVEALPKNAGGKVLKHELRRKLSDGGGG